MNQINLKGALLVVGGIVIGVVLTVTCMNAVGHSNAEGQVMTAASTAQAQPPGAVAAETHHAIPAPTVSTVGNQRAAVPQTPVAPHATPVDDDKHPHDWITPADLAKQNTAKNGTAADPSSPQYKSSHQTYYVYGGDGSIPDHSALPTAVSGVVSNGQPMQTVTVETNYVYTNCVDPPSVTRGRYYRRPPVH